MKSRLLTVILVMIGIVANAQISNPVEWSADATLNDNGASGVLKLSATVEPGWHLYGMDLPEGGPRSTDIKFTKLQNVEFTGGYDVNPAPVEKVDMIFHLKLSSWDGGVEITRHFRVLDPSKPYFIEGDVAFQACNDRSCLAPSKYAFGCGEAVAVEESVQESVDSAVVMQTDVSAGASNEGWWKPVEYPAESATPGVEVSDASWWYIFIWGFLGGLLALLTPCVWPMIPLTVSFFMKKGGSRSKGIRDAVLYGVSIIVIYLALGLAVTWIYGASKLNELSTNALFNLLFFALLVVFAISFFGAFEIKLPSRWSNATDSRAERTGGLLSIFFMAFTLALVSFSCTGPIVGTLLVEAATMGSMAGPAIGMGAFALALALPFTLFAIFPTMLKQLPRSGGWLNSVKVVLGFLELALSLKFLSVADLAYGWGILDREVFISLWVVIFLLLGLYLLGKIRFSHDSEVKTIGTFRFFLALASLSFSVYLLPGLWGAPLKGASAFVPPLYTQDFNLYNGGEFEEFDDYERGMEYASANNRPVLIDFSGYGCVNCRKMEGAVFDTDEISNLVKENFVLIKLMADDKRELTEPVTVVENGRTVILNTVGDKWSWLERMKFGANTLPMYVMLDNNGSALEAPYYYDENVEKFANWLNSGIKSYNQGK